MRMVGWNEAPLERQIDRWLGLALIAVIMGAYLIATLVLWL